MIPQLNDEELAFLNSAFDLARQGSTSELIALIAQGLPANLTNSAGDSLLILAADHSHPRTVRALLRVGADTSRINERGQTALAAAVFRHDPACLQLLLDAGADPALGERSALAIAEFFGLAEMQTMLRDREVGIDPVG